MQFDRDAIAPGNSADASMDEILASIRGIIAEEPLSYRHRRPAKAVVRKSVATSGHPAVSDRSRDATQVVRRAVHASPAPRLSHDGVGGDPILAELLAGEQAPAVADAARDTALAAVPPIAVQIAVAVAPEAGRRDAASVLDALAAGLAAAPPQQGIPDALSSGARPAEVVADPVPEMPILGTAVAADDPVSGSTTPCDSLAAEGVVALAPMGAAARAAVDESAEPAPKASPAPASFEDTIATMLRPLLREWLDTHLPRMVERALRAELGAELSADLRKDPASTTAAAPPH